MPATVTLRKTEPQKLKLPRYVRRIKGKLYFATKHKYYGALPELHEPDFVATYIGKCELAGLPVPQQLAPTPNAPSGPAALAYLPASIGWFIDKYMDPKASPQWRRFAKMTRYNYGRALIQIKASKIGPALLADMTTENLDVYLAEQARESTSRADQHKFLLSNLWDFAKDFPIFKRHGKSNPTLEAKVHYSVEQGHKPWPAPIIHKYLDGANPSQTCALYLLLYTGQRRGDCCAMEWDDLSGPLAPGVRINVVQEKTGEVMSLRAHKNLVAFLKTWPHHHKKILTSSWKTPYTPDSLSHRVKDRLREIGAEQFTLHGLRKNAGVALAEAGATVPEIMAVLGHRTPKMALEYCREANKQTLNDSAMDKWEAMA
jgi:integrase